MKGKASSFAAELPPRCRVAGTPAGVGPYTQEQHAAMREAKLSMEDTPAIKILVTVQPIARQQLDKIDWNKPREELPAPIREAACPVLDSAPGWATIVSPDGTLMRVRVR